MSPYLQRKGSQIIICMANCRWVCRPLACFKVSNHATFFFLAGWLNTFVKCRVNLSEQWVMGLSAPILTLVPPDGRLEMWFLLKGIIANAARWLAKCIFLKIQQTLSDKTSLRKFLFILIISEIVIWNNAGRFYGNRTEYIKYFITFVQFVVSVLGVVLTKIAVLPKLFSKEWAERVSLYTLYIK